MLTNWKSLGHGRYIAGNVHVYLWDDAGPSLFVGHRFVRLLDSAERAYIVNNAE